MVPSMGIVFLTHGVYVIFSNFVCACVELACINNNRAGLIKNGQGGQLNQLRCFVGSLHMALKHAKVPPPVPFVARRVTVPLTVTIMKIYFRNQDYVTNSNKYLTLSYIKYVINHKHVLKISH